MEFKTFLECQNIKFPEAFQEFWDLYPQGRRSDKVRCREKYKKLFKKGLHPKIIVTLTLQISAYNAKKKLNPPFLRAWKLSKTWLNGECWEDDIEEPPRPPSRIENRCTNVDTPALQYNAYLQRKASWEKNCCNRPFPEGQKSLQDMKDYFKKISRQKNE